MKGFPLRVKTPLFMHRDYLPSLHHQFWLGAMTLAFQFLQLTANDLSFLQSNNYGLPAFGSNKLFFCILALQNAKVSLYLWDGMHWAAYAAHVQLSGHLSGLKHLLFFRAIHCLLSGPILLFTPISPAA